MIMKKRYVIGLVVAFPLGLLSVLVGPSLALQTLGSAATVFVGDSDDWRDHCPDAQRYVVPPDGSEEYSEHWVCDDGASTIVIYKDVDATPYSDAQSAEEIKDMSLNLAIAQGQGSQILSDGPTWIEIVGTPPNP